MTDFNPSEWLTTKEAAELSGYKPVSVRWMVREGKIEGQKMGRDWVVNRESLLNYVDKMEKLGTAKHDPTKSD
jgi:excisionase family DNA binding protein